MNIKETLDKFYSDIIYNHWEFLNNTYKSNIKTQYHRSKICSYENIKIVKENVFNMLGPIPVFWFLTEIISYLKLSGPYYNIEKGLLVLQQMLQGCSISEMEIYDSNNGYYRIYKKLFIDEYDWLNKKLDQMLECCFSSSYTRLLYSSLNNPQNMRHVTMFLDGRHSKITIEDIDLDKKHLYSYKLKKNALNTQFIIDSAGYIIYISASLPASNSTDDNMLINNVNLNKFFKLSDNLCFDGVYNNTLDELINKYNNINFDINQRNFTFPIRKDKNVELKESEKLFNHELSAYRSSIESLFASFVNIFKRFGNRSNVRITKDKTYNIQLKLCCVLYNIKRFTELNNIQNNDFYNLWLNDNFDFFDNIKGYTDVEATNKTSFKMENINNMKEIQEDIISNLLKTTSLNTNNRMNIDKRENTSGNEDKEYEIQYIIRHRKVGNGIEYEVKWKNYSKKFNSWVHESDIISKDIIDDYKKSLEA